MALFGNDNQTMGYLNAPQAPNQTQLDKQNLASSEGFKNYLSSMGMSVPSFVSNPQNDYERKLAEEWTSKRVSDFIDYGGGPTRPEFQSLIDPKTGLLKGALNYEGSQIAGLTSALGDMSGRLDNVQLDKQGLEALRKEGLRTGPSAWADLMGAQVTQKELENLDKVASQANSSSAMAQGDLAMRGGLSSGARERIGNNTSRAINQGTQGVRRDTRKGLLDIGIQDETNRLGILSQLPGMEYQAIQPDMQKAMFLNEAQMTEQGRNLDTQKFNAGVLNDASKYNIGNTMNEKLQERAFDVNAYNEAMKAFAANKQGDAISNSGGGGCFITTAVCDYLGLPDDNHFLNTFRQFRDEHMGGKNSEELKHYYEVAPKIVERIKGDDDILSHLLSEFLVPAYSHIKNCNFDEAHKIYKEMVQELEMKVEGA